MHLFDIRGLDKGDAMQSTQQVSNENTLPLIQGVYTASLKPKWVLVKVPRKGALDIEMGRYGDSKNGFG